jgi:glyoxylase-like metal-dependent hydrolase (beta-lactamase superfamily II)
MSDPMETLPPIVRPERMTRVSEHVHVIPDGGVRGVPNVGIVVGHQRTLVIDAGMGERNGAIVYEAARTMGGERPMLLVTTHVHPEHDLGAQAFPSDVMMIRARAQQEEIREEGMRVADDFRARSVAFRDLLEGARFRDADVEFDRRLTLDLGGVRVMLAAMGANHTRGDTVAFVADDRVLFSGDLAMTGAPAFATRRSRVTRWITSLDELESLRADVVVPSHGPIGDTRLIAAYRAHLTGILTRVRELRADGVDVSGAVRIVGAERAADFGDVERLEGAVRAAYRESEEAAATPAKQTRQHGEDV